MMIGPHIFEQGHAELQDYASGQRATSADITAQGLQGPRVVPSPSLIHHPTRDTLNNTVPDPSIDR